MPPERRGGLDGFSDRFIRDIVRLELSRGYLWPTAVQSSLEHWATFVRHPYRRLLIDDGNDGCGGWECCGNPLVARELLGFVARALPRGSARELRKRLDELDALY
ncbi:hypothetical protein GCM10011609_81750 [Lentzea pudingi]|uniref:Uncharacterized protein n=1 Tax=Lentzea pudingi TaxID=1789439 RepID=A0ABQ2IQB5_9PSEU|nr:hypothetical protein [Lentzea pudingi]GGN26741.1 hypothetical protein GCM10011609_81750 [Lentzea pudingi]